MSLEKLSRRKRKIAEEGLAIIRGIKSEKKSAASRRNGKLGGRPLGKKNKKRKP